MSPPRAAAHYVQVFSVSSAAIVADKKKTSLEKTLDMTADWTAHHLSL